MRMSSQRLVDFHLKSAMLRRLLEQKAHSIQQKYFHIKQQFFAHQKMLLFGRTFGYVTQCEHSV